jgi:opacity protein-like surface antigen
MKKILIAGSMLAALSTSALAEHFYIRVDGGASFREKMYSKTENDLFTSNDLNVSKTLGQLGLGFGGYIADNVRAELNFTYFFNANYSFPTNFIPTNQNVLNLIYKATNKTFGPAAPTTPEALAPLLVAGAKIDDPVVIAALKANPIVPLNPGTDLQKSLVAVINSSGQSQLKALKIEDLTVKSFSIMPRLYYDFWNFGAGNMFFGIGLGYANASASIPFTPTLNVNPVVDFTPAKALVVADPNAVPPVAAAAAVPAFYTVTTPAATFVAPEATLKTKTANNFAWSAHLGFDYKLESMEGVKLNVEYYYSDMGKLGKLTLDSTRTDSNLESNLESNLYLRSHNVTVGLRFDM